MMMMMIMIMITIMIMIRIIDISCIDIIITQLLVQMKARLRKATILLWRSGDVWNPLGNFTSTDFTSTVKSREEVTGR